MTDDHWYGLNFNGTAAAEKFSDPSIPSIELFKTLNVSFDIEPLDNSASVTSSVLNPLTLSITPTTVPISGGICFLLGGLIPLWKISKQR